MSVHVLLNLLNELGEKKRCKALSSMTLAFSNEFDAFNNTLAQLQDSVYHMIPTLHFIRCCLHKLVKISPLENAIFMDANA